LPECAFMAVTICSVRLKRHRRQLGLSHSLFLTTHLKPTWLVDVSNMPCDEFCGLGHQGMWARVVVVLKEQFPRLTPEQRTNCVSE
jgi:hypothetical protein